jgi:hypothetical protein
VFCLDEGAIEANLHLYISTGAIDSSEQTLGKSA